MAPTATVAHYCAHISILRKLQELASTSLLPSTDISIGNGVYVLVFSDARRSADKAKLCYIVGQLFDAMQDGSIYHLFSCSSHNSRRPVNAIGSAELLSASEAIDKGKMPVCPFSAIYNTAIPLVIALGGWIVVKCLPLYPRSVTVQTYQLAAMLT